MPDILIRMEMPKSCADCHDADLPTAIAWLGAKCPWAHGIIDPGVYDLRQDRHPNCPLHELPEHGDLIEKDLVLEYPTEWFYDDPYISLSDIKAAPVVIPAERSDTDA